MTRLCMALSLCMKIGLELYINLQRYGQQYQVKSVQSSSDLVSTIF